MRTVMDEETRKQKRKEWARRYYIKHKSKLAEYRREHKDYYDDYRKTHKDRIKNNAKLWRLKNKDKINANRRRYIKNNPDKVATWRRKWYLNHKEENRQNSRNYYSRNKQRVYERTKAYAKEKRKTDVGFFMQTDFKNALNFTIKSRLNNKKPRHNRPPKVEKLLGCAVEQFILHIEANWKEGMSWDNWSRRGWNLKYIQAPHTFDLTDTENQKKCFHYTNILPAWTA